MGLRAANWTCAFALAQTEHMISALQRSGLAHRGRNANTTDPLIDKRKQIRRLSSTLTGSSRVISSAAASVA
ncbi:hypothetical protein BM1_03672 [Bipolaris maydis]|nr:hypothetical protein BM1_03672 [Bipolaris maydis]